MRRVHQDQLAVKRQAAGSTSQPDRPNEKLAWCLLSAEALRRGYCRKDGTPNTRAFTKALESAGVEIRGTRKQRVICPADVDAAWSRLPVLKASSPSADDDDVVASLLKGGW